MLESKRRAIIFFSLAVLLAAVSGFLVLQKVQALNSDLGTIVTVYTASGEISSRKAVTPDDVTTAEIPQEYLRDEHITDVDELMNKVSVVPLSEGDIITENILKEASAVTEANNRLVSMLRSEKVSFDENLIALDRVDIVVSHNFEEEPVTEVFMEDVKVARVAEEDEEFRGVQLEVPYENVSELIHMQNYADTLRVVKANVAETEQQEETSDQETQENNQTGNDADDNADNAEGNDGNGEDNDDQSDEN